MIDPFTSGQDDDHLTLLGAPAIRSRLELSQIVTETYPDLTQKSFEQNIECPCIMVRWTGGGWIVAVPPVVNLTTGDRVWIADATNDTLLEVTEPARSFIDENTGRVVFSVVTVREVS